MCISTRSLPSVKTNLAIIAGMLLVFSISMYFRPSMTILTDNDVSTKYQDKSIEQLLGSKIIPMKLDKGSDVRKNVAKIVKHIDNGYLIITNVSRNIATVDLPTENIEKRTEISNITDLNLPIPRSQPDGKHSITASESYWNWVDSLVTSSGLYHELDDVVHILHTMRTSPVTSVSRFTYGSSLKFTVILSRVQRFVFKPYLGDIGFENPRHEIASFLMDRILGMRKAPYVTGRVLDVSKEVLPVADAKLANFFTLHSNGTVCFTFKTRPFCYDRGLIPGAIIYYIRRPSNWYHGKRNLHHPFHPLGDFHGIVGTFNINNDTLCKITQSTPPYTNPTIYMDLYDIAILDYLTLHMDRKHYYLTSQPGQTHLLTAHIDHGLSFMGKPGLGCKFLISSLRQCCRIRQKTFDPLLEIYNLGEKLHQQFDNLTRNDPLYPILTHEEIRGIWGRLGDVLGIVDTCKLSVGRELFVV